MQEKIKAILSRSDGLSPEFKTFLLTLAKGCSSIDEIKSKINNYEYVKTEYKWAARFFAKEILCQLEH